MADAHAPSTWEGERPYIASSIPVCAPLFFLTKQKKKKREKVKRKVGKKNPIEVNSTNNNNINLILSI